ncbi:F-box/LRR-repeat protein 14 [Acorus calamus]|uniref:F-box/LRR-repeat protein 14 n=1 Tax=Acorus calamus TaxID=4465 RepID=A0AAV9EUC4_ACOCL|nr:F-box/LRR-repeat protein 14 [Acorus calamus]
MEDLPYPLVVDILGRLRKASDRNSVSLTCKRILAIDNEHRQSIRVGCRLQSAYEALTSLCVRFPNLQTVEIDYSGWTSVLGKQLDDQGLNILACHCPSLTNLTLSFCTYITDVGLAHLASCSNLRSLKLNFIPGISGRGMLSLVVGCKDLLNLSLVRCLNVRSFEWLEYLGKFGNLEELFIKNCRAIGEGDLIKLGPGWMKLKRLEFKMDCDFRYAKAYDKLVALRCESLRELSLVNCIISPGRGLSCMLGMCEALEKVHLDMCNGITDGDIAALASKSKRLKSFSLHLSPGFFGLTNVSYRLTDECLKAVACGCPNLEEFRLVYSKGDFPFFFYLSLDGLLTLIQSCPIRVLALEAAYFFDDLGMEALCSANLLSTLELVQCPKISDEGIQFINRYPLLTTLKLSKCVGVTDMGLKLLIGSKKLEWLMVEDCPWITLEGIKERKKNCMAECKIHLYEVSTFMRLQASERDAFR